MDADLGVIGAGISGLALAHRAAEDGKRVVVLERRDRIGGCIHSHRSGDHWFEMGAHSAYNSYTGFIELAERSGVATSAVERGPARARFGLLRNGEPSWLSPPKVLLQLSWLELGLNSPRAALGWLTGKRGKTMEGYFGALVGRKNFARVLSPFFAAVPSQSADGFPAEGPGSLFKKRERREDFIRSFGFEGGLQAVCDGIAAHEGINVRTGAAVTAVERAGEGFAIAVGDERIEVAHLGIAAPADTAARLLGPLAPDLADQIARVQTVKVETVGVRLPRSVTELPECAFLVAVDDVFFSMVTRDPFPDSDQRAFAFHFKPGVPRADKLARMAQVLGVGPDRLEDLVEQELTLPSPKLGHGELVADIDRALASERIALTGNYFGGLAIEDCVQRSLSEWARVAS